MLDELGEHDFEVAPSEDEHPVEALSSDGAYESFGVRPRCPDRDVDDSDPLSGEDGTEGGDECRVSATDQERDRRRPVCELHADVPGLLVPKTSSGPSKWTFITTTLLSKMEHGPLSPLCPKRSAESLPHGQPGPV